MLFDVLYVWLVGWVVVVVVDVVVFLSRAFLSLVLPTRTIFYSNSFWWWNDDGWRWRCQTDGPSGCPPSSIYLKTRLTLFYGLEAMRSHRQCIYNTSVYFTVSNFVPGRLRNPVKWNSSKMMTTRLDDRLSGYWFSKEKEKLLSICFKRGIFIFSQIVRCQLASLDVVFVTECQTVSTLAINSENKGWSQQITYEALRDVWHILLWPRRPLKLSRENETKQKKNPSRSGIFDFSLSNLLNSFPVENGFRSLVSGSRATSSFLMRLARCG